MTDPGMEINRENIFEKKSLAEFLSGHHYQQVSLRKIDTGHLVIQATINDVPGSFILDSGAGATVVDEKNAQLFQLNAVIENTIGAGAGGTGLTVYTAADNRISIGEFTIFPFKMAVMNFQHVIEGLQQHGITETIHGVIGADILEQGSAIIDYVGKHLYLMIK